MNLREARLVFGLSEQYTDEQLREAWQFLVHAFHPDKFPTDRQKALATGHMIQLASAYKLLQEATTCQSGLTYDGNVIGFHRRRAAKQMGFDWSDYGEVVYHEDKDT